jgi:DNA repair exonuclease SbcCD ATPase subunit
VADTIQIEVYKQQYKRVWEIWSKAVKEPLKRIAEHTKEIDALDAKKEKLSPDDEKRRKELIAERERCQKTVDQATMELQQNLANIQPLEKATKDEMHELLKWMKKQYESIKSGLTLSPGIKLKPDTDFDLKKMKLKGQGVILEWKF